MSHSEVAHLKVDQGDIDQGDRSLIFYFERGRELGVKSLKDPSIFYANSG
jgi:hypothetical protein